MKIFTLLSALTCCSALSMEFDSDFPTFQNFMKKYGRHYATQAETQGRFQIFKDNLKKIRQRNASPGLDNHGVNMFTDIHPNEFKAQYLGLQAPIHDNFFTENHVEVKYNKTELMMANMGSIKSINWATKGATTAVKNQGQCGSCWSFSAAEQVESTVFLNTGVLNKLSEQTLVSCDTVDHGCAGGNPINGFAQFANWGGDMFSSDYPYTSGITQSDGTCKGIKKSDIAPNSAPNSYSMVSSSASQEARMLAQIQKSPMSVCVDAELWQTYTSGVITTASNCGTELDHAVQAVGVNTDTFNGEPLTYWIVRNSWGPTWGNSGYVYLQVNENTCGVTQQATIVQLA